MFHSRFSSASKRKVQSQNSLKDYFDDDDDDNEMDSSQPTGTADEIDPLDEFMWVEST